MFHNHTDNALTHFLQKHYLLPVSVPSHQKSVGLYNDSRPDFDTDMLHLMLSYQSHLLTLTPEFLPACLESHRLIPPVTSHHYAPYVSPHLQPAGRKTVRLPYRNLPEPVLPLYFVLHLLHSVPVCNLQLLQPLLCRIFESWYFPFLKDLPLTLPQIFHVSLSPAHKHAPPELPDQSAPTVRFPE